MNISREKLKALTQSVLQRALKEKQEAQKKAENDPKIDQKAMQASAHLRSIPSDVRRAIGCQKNVRRDAIKATLVKEIVSKIWPKREQEIKNEIIMIAMNSKNEAELIRNVGRIKATR